jgi:hypothetical protein
MPAQTDIQEGPIKETYRAVPDNLVFLKNPGFPLSQRFLSGNLFDIGASI